MSKVQTLPPTDAIKDPEVRAFCEALANAWNLRNGNIEVGEEERFVTKGELSEATLNAFADALGASFAPGGPPVPASGGDSPSIPTPNPAALRLDELLRARIALLAIPATADIRARVGEAEAGMLSTRNVQATRDFALASAVNTIWATVGNATSIIQDGALARATPVTADASAWNQVQATITDPNTGEYVSTAAVRQDFNAYAAGTNGKLEATWTLRVNANNHIAGIGLGIYAPGDNQPITSSFNVIADQFFVYGENTPIGSAPFRVDTNTGVTYLNTAIIEDGTVTNAKIGNQIYSTSWANSGGTAGWLLDKDGNAYFQNCTVAGTSTVGRLNVVGTVQSSVFVPNNSVGVVVHNSGRPVVVAVWSPSGNASLASMDDNSFSVRVDFAGDATAYYSYF